MASFPPAGIGEDSSKFKLSFEDKTISSETDGGYIYTRPRHGRRPRRIIKTGFTDIPEADKIQLESFFMTNGKHTMFSYRLPDTGATINCRISGEPPSIEYKGMGGNHRYDVTGVELTEV